MPSSFFEIIELENGEIGLRRAGEDEGPLVSIKFSDEVLHAIDDIKLEVVKNMIEAGMETVAEHSASGIEFEASFEVGGEEETVIPTDRVVH